MSKVLTETKFKVVHFDCTDCDRKCIQTSDRIQHFKCCSDCHFKAALKAINLVFNNPRVETISCRNREEAA